MTNKKSYSYALTFVSPLFIILFILLYVTHMSELSLATTILVCVGFLLNTVCGLLSFKYKNFIYIIPIIFQFLLFIVGTQNNIIITTLYIFPIVLAFYTMNKPYIISVIGVNVISYFISNCIRYTHYDPRHPIIGSFGLCVIYSFEMATIIISLLSYVKYIKFVNKELKKKNEESKKSQQDTIKFCVNALSYHSPYLRIHTQNVAFYTTLILNELQIKKTYKNKITDKFIDDCRFGALVHDIGKIYISDSILDKPSKLTKEEFDLIKSHTSKGEELFLSLPYNSMDRETFDVCMNCIKYHHERINGSGYVGIKGDKIPLESRIIAVADTMDAILSYRSYKQPKTFDETFEILNDGSLFDLDIVDCVRNLKNEIIEYSDCANIRLKKEIFK